MTTLITYVFGLLLVGGLLFLVASFAFGRGEEMVPALPEGTPVELPDDRPADGADLRGLRLSVVLRGYRMDEVDWLLDRLAEQVDSRDREIARLRSVLHVEPVPVGAVAGNGSAEAGDLHGGELHGGELRGGELRGGELRGGELRGGELRGGELRGADLDRGDLRGGDLHGGDLDRGDLRGGDLHGGGLRGRDRSVEERSVGERSVGDRSGGERSVEERSVDPLEDAERDRHAGERPRDGAE